jgi:Cof subfamily protein (haloacid dehalogenase superfamily)
MALPRFILVDLDGTVLREGRGISDRTLQAFARARELGIQPLVATGRPRASALRWALALGVEGGLVCHNGAAVYDREARLIAETTIPEATARELVRAARDYPVHFHGFEGDTWLYEREWPGTERYRSRSGLPGRQVDFDRETELRFHKAMFVAGEAEAPAIAADLGRDFAGRLEVYPTGSGFVELVAPGISKGRSASLLVASLGGSMAEVLAFGDAWNDEDMLLMAGTGVAMGNAPEALRLRVGRVAAGVEEDGVARWLEELFNPPS